jgi:hypothetical protein
MPFEHDQVVSAQFQQLAAERARALGEYEASRLSDDADRTMIAADRILDADAKLQALERVANKLATSQQPAPLPGSDDLSHRDVSLARHYGLTAQELGAAKSWTADSSMTDEAKVRSYVDNRQRLRQMRASGEYRDDQGVVRR